jgi:hypothetical protein
MNWTIEEQYPSELLISHSAHVISAEMFAQTQIK